MLPLVHQSSTHHVLNISLIGMGQSPFSHGGKNEHASVNVWDIDVVADGAPVQAAATANTGGSKSLFAGPNTDWAYPPLWSGAYFCWKQGDHLLDGATREAELDLYKALMRSTRRALNGHRTGDSFGDGGGKVLATHFGGLTNWDSASPWAVEKETPAHVHDLMIIDAQLADAPMKQQV